MTSSVQRRAEQRPAKQQLTTLPVFRLAPSRIDGQRVDELARHLLRDERYSASEREDRVILRSKSRVLEIFRESGGIWWADEERLWNVEAKPRLPEEEKARGLAEVFLKEGGLLPQLREPFSIGFTGFGGTYVSTVAEKGRRQDRRLDVQVNYGVTVRLPGGHGESENVPVVGGGGEFNVTIGDGGEVIGFSGAWRPVEEKPFEAEIVPQEAADAEFRRRTQKMSVTSVSTHLAYFAAPASSGQEFLYPVYVYRAEATVDDRKLPLRLITIPATTFGPPAPKVEAQPKRSPKKLHVTDEEKARRGLSSLSIESQALAQATTALRFNPFEAGTSWIGTSGGLTGSKKNAQGFVDGLSAAGWKINFNWGDANAWESDWRRNDDDYVDAADFVFYTGHANMDGWVLSKPDDTFLHFNETGASPASPGDLWGQQDLEWAVVAACGPLQDNVISPGGGDVFARWDGAFDGLHILLGYGAITFDNEDEGRLLVKYAREGQTLINAWFRAAREVQPSTNGSPAPDGPRIWVGAMYATKSGVSDPGSDHLWGYGSVAADPKSPNGFVAIWTTT